MKRLLSVLLISALCIGATACGNSASSSAPASSVPTSQTAPSSAAESTAAPWVPDSSFNIRVPMAAGGTMDTAARIIGQGLQKAYNQTVIVNNITGANGAIAASDLLSYDADPTELMAAGINLFTLAPLFNKDIQVSLDDFKVVSSMLKDDFILYVAPQNSKINSFEELMEYGKNNRVLIGSNSPGGTTHMLPTALFGEAGIEMEAVTSDGSGKDLLALISGNVDCVVATSTVGRQFVEEGSIIPIAVFSDENYTGFDGFTVPTVKSKGYDIVFVSCNFLLTRAGVDQAIVDQMYQSILAYYETDECKELTGNAGYVPDPADGASVRKTVENAAALCQSIYEKYYRQ